MSSDEWKLCSTNHLQTVVLHFLKQSNTFCSFVHTPYLSYAPTCFPSTWSYLWVRSNAAFGHMVKFNLSKTITGHCLQRSLSNRIHKVPCSTRKDRQRWQLLSSVERSCCDNTRTLIECCLSFSGNKSSLIAYQGNSMGQITTFWTLRTCISLPALIFFQSILESIRGTAPVDCVIRNIWCWLLPAGCRPSALSTGGFVHLSSLV